MLLKILGRCFSFSLQLFIIQVRICECAKNQGNVITVTEPGKDAIWKSGPNSYSITWSQSKFSFKWNIVLLDSERNKITDISTGLREFNEVKMTHQWLVPSSVQSGSYRIQICATSVPDECGSSDVFSIRNSKNPGAADESDFDAFSSVHDNQAIPFAQLSNITGERKANLKILLPHELRRQRRLEKEGLYFKRMTEQIRRQKLEECTIERVHQPSKEAFVERYMKHGKPAILTGMMDSWESTKSWKFEELGKVLTKGVKVDLMEDLTCYALWNEFRSRFSDMYKEPSKVIMNDFDQIYPELLEDVRFPEFTKDYTEVIDEDIRPPRLLFEMAPKRSGLHWRVEHLNASLWSALITGRKRWGLYPPSRYFVPGVIHNNHQTQDSQQSESFTWWIYTRPHIKDKYKPLECMQGTGEILYIPSGWWWSNLNIDDSITLQKSVCDETSIRACMDELKEMADSAGDNYFGDAFIQLRHYLAIHEPGLLTDDDRQFRSPIRGLGITNHDHGNRHHENVWEKYFMEGLEVEDSSPRNAG